MKFLALLLVIALAIGGLAAWEIYAPIGPPAGTPDTSAVYVDIRPGTGTQAIAEQLQHAGIIRNQYAFDLLRMLKRGRLKAGEYRFNHPASATEVYARIAAGDIYTITLTIPEGYNIFEVANAVADAGLASHDAFLAAEQSNTSLIHDLSPNAPSLEGYLFPDTYRFSRHTPPIEILSTMVRRFRQESTRLGLAADATMSIADTITLASLVEKEVNQNSERPLVAGVFVNRLAQGIPLATDPSVIYAALLENRYRGTIYESDLHSPSLYNTYTHTGLPPGPICNPGVAAIKAALSPAHTNYLYFVADAQGHSRFAATLKEHAQQVQEYRRAMHNPAP